MGLRLVDTSLPPLERKKLHALTQDHCTSPLTPLQDHPTSTNNTARSVGCCCCCCRCCWRRLWPPTHSGALPPSERRKVAARCWLCSANGCRLSSAAWERRWDVPPSRQRRPPPFFRCLRQVCHQMNGTIFVKLATVGFSIKIQIKIKIELNQFLDDSLYFKIFFSRFYFTTTVFTHNKS